MIHRLVNYFEDFKCIAGDCKDTCCVGWELDIDEESFEKYKKVKGKFGKRLHSFMVEGKDETGECNTFRLVGNRCPFLNKNNLCDIYIELGEKALCKVCSEYPRFKIDFGNTRESGLSLSCEVVGELLFSKTEALSLVERELTDKESSEGGEIFFEEEILSLRNRLLEILQKRDTRIAERLYEYLVCVEEGQEAINSEEELWLNKDFDFSLFEGNFPFEEFYEELFYLLNGMEVLDEEWEENFKKIEASYSREVGIKFWSLVEADETREIWMEQLLSYLTFRYVMKAVYDADILSKVKFVMFSFYVIRMMLAVRLEEKGSLEKEDMIDICRIYSKEVEHSEENIAYLMEEFIFSDIFTIENMGKGVRDAWFNKR